MARRSSAGVVRARRATPARPGLELVPDLAFELLFGRSAPDQGPPRPARVQRPERGPPATRFDAGERDRATPPAPAL